MKRCQKLDFKAAAAAIRQAAAKQFALVNGSELLDDLKDTPAEIFDERVCYRIDGQWLPLADAAFELVGHRGLPNDTLPDYLESLSTPARPTIRDLSCIAVVPALAPSHDMGGFFNQDALRATVSCSMSPTPVPSFISSLFTRNKHSTGVPVVA